MVEEDTVVAVLAAMSNATQAVRQIRSGGVDPKEISIIARAHGVEEISAGYYSLGRGPHYLGNDSPFWTGLWAEGLQGGFLSIPGLGPVVIVGPLLESLLGRLDACGPNDGHPIQRALRDNGVPAAVGKKYEDAVKANMVLVLVRGPTDDVARAAAAMSRTHVLELGFHA